MTEPASRPLRTWRPMAAWTAGILLALGLAWFVGAVVVPVWQVHDIVRRHSAGDANDVACLGGPHIALSKAMLYLRLTKGRSSERWRVAAILSHCGKEALPAARRLFEDSSEDLLVRTQAAGCLGKVGDAGVVDALITGLLEEKPQLRESAASALGELGDERAIGPLISALRDWKHEAGTGVGASNQAGWALVRFGKPAVDPLLAALDETKRPDWERAHIMWILGRIGDKRAREPLKALRAADSPELKQAAYWALESLERRSSGIRSVSPPHGIPSE